ncbi:hypothetical protein A2Z67_02815 [Candidatus Woesebacteria bacterium RBG_13_36_22]|uniref:FCP1 homology domain-containing protein n=1 Tax=Candidatus Woesebacteria bacterium RBG_13_36_22 TaxID=1802478 RepID=A0A1F7X6B5_9BACT|nr:MAG: hypothetical protein A2Z67_02815 [Candidatus Woesebacteria bacterium RBG_13_36_22]
MKYVVIEKAENPEGSYYVDFDKTLAYHRTEWGADKTGKPIPKMMARVKRWLEQGKKVKIFTARATNTKMKKEIQDWLEDNGLPRLEVTNVKGTDVIEIYDDRARQVKPNTGEVK